MISVVAFAVGAVVGAVVGTVGLVLFDAYVLSKEL